jgi:CDP-diacylglycerol--inositol 3-phosphatidyltransferase
MKWTNTPIDLDFFPSVISALSWPELIAAITFPVFAYKNFLVNVVQLWKASKILVGVDLADRQEAREKAALLKEN